RLDGIFLTHFHSDHISEIYEANLSSWVQGRPQPLKVFGGEGIAELVSGVNATYAFDREHRIEHHGEALLRPDLGILKPELVTATTVIEDGDLRILAYQASHPPVDPSLGFRVEYRGRSVVISGDSNVTDATLSISGGADLLLHDALSVPAVTSLSEGFAAEGRARISKIMADVVEYHASLESIIELGSQTDIGMVAYYHLVPNASNALFTRFFERDLPDNYLIATDRMWFDMPVGSKDIEVVEP
ncbi:MAG: MBL fold metallo-hydrolase, partial [Gammaproteobacteria bacterium]